MLDELHGFFAWPALCVSDTLLFAISLTYWLFLNCVLLIKDRIFISRLEFLRLYPLARFVLLDALSRALKAVHEELETQRSIDVLQWAVSPLQELPQRVALIVSWGAYEGICLLQRWR